MTNKMRFLAGLFSLLFAFVMLFSLFYLAAEVGHSCTGEDCPICHEMKICAQVLHTFGKAAPAFAPVCLMAQEAPALLTPESSGRDFFTLVSLKVKLSD